jgi:CMP-N,N'-diacetyllegionaminic acid synthase
LPTESQSVLGIIPARGGSKGIPRKNLRELAGKPVIAYSIEAARHSRLLTEFIVTTDDDEIAAVSERLGSRVLMRPAALAGDKMPMVPVVEHVLAEMRRLGRSHEVIVLLQPTSPQRTAEDIDCCINLLLESEADSVMSVYDVGDIHPARMYHLEEGYLRPYAAEPAGNLRQDLPKVYHRNGAVYAVRSAYFERHRRIIGEHPLAYLMPRERSLILDEPFDFRLAELLMSD